MAPLWSQVLDFWWVQISRSSRLSTMLSTMPPSIKTLTNIEQYLSIYCRIFAEYFLASCHTSRSAPRGGGGGGGGGGASCHTSRSAPSRPHPLPSPSSHPPRQKKEAFHVPCSDITWGWKLHEGGLFWQINSIYIKMVTLLVWIS